MGTVKLIVRDRLNWARQGNLPKTVIKALACEYLALSEGLRTPNFLICSRVPGVRLLPQSTLTQVRVRVRRMSGENAPVQRRPASV